MCINNRPRELIFRLCFDPDRRFPLFALSKYFIPYKSKYLYKKIIRLTSILFFYHQPKGNIWRKSNLQKLSEIEMNEDSSCTTFRCLFFLFFHNNQDMNIVLFHFSSRIFYANEENQSSKNFDSFFSHILTSGPVRRQKKYRSYSNDLIYKHHYYS